MTEYITVTTVSIFKHRYVVPVSKVPTTYKELPEQTVRYAIKEDEVEEFSQDFVKESILESDVISQETLLKLFDKELAYLKEWPTEKKLEWINNLVHK